MSSAQVPEGYKQTEVGVIPEDWELKTIGDLGSVSSGGTPSRANPLYWGGDIPWITTTQIDFNFITDAEQFITQDGLNNSAAKVFLPGTLLMAMYGQGKTRGKVARLEIEASINQACAAISLNENIEHEYVFIYLVSQYEIIRTLSNIGNQENLNGQIIKSIKIALPPRLEQRAIAQALSDVDALIASLDKLIAKQRQLKTAAMQQLLTGKMRLPGFGEGKGYKQTEIGAIPEDWIVVPLKAICKVNQGLQIAIEERLSYPTIKSRPYITIQAINSGEFIEYINSYSSTVCCEESDVLMTRTGNTGIVITDISGVFHNNFFKVNFDRKRLDKNFFVYYLRAKKTQKIILEKAGTSTIPDLNHNDFYSIKIALPSFKEQRVIATVLSNMDDATTALETRRAKTQAIKQGMMQELLTGRTRLV